MIWYCDVCVVCMEYAIEIRTQHRSLAAFSYLKVFHLLTYLFI